MPEANTFAKGVKNGSSPSQEVHSNTFTDLSYFVAHAMSDHYPNRNAGPFNHTPDVDENQKALGLLQDQMSLAAVAALNELKVRRLYNLA